VAFSDAGSGDPTIVFIPGLVGDQSDFASQVTHFELSHRVVTIDLPGSGISGKDRSEWSMAAFGEDVATVIDHLRLRDVVLVGHSFGGDVTVEAALLLGDRVRGIVWISTYRTLGSPPDSIRLAQWLAPFDDDFPAAMEDLTRRNFGAEADRDMVDRVVARMVASDPTMVRSVLRAKMWNEAAVLAGLRKLHLPVIAINPDFKSNDGESLNAVGVELRVIPRTGHYTMMEAPAAFNTALEGIVAALPGR
jgi:pimeloyl-ACP methyl ester carboxylesterase